MKNDNTLVQNKVLWGGGLLLITSKPSGFSCALMR